MKAAKLREMTDDEIRQMCTDTSKELFQLKMKKGSGDSSEQPLRIRTMRREVARIKTVMKQRGI
ncbi:MAG: 50S ribosomal protein L29 [Verrucomicrobia bacterium]|nr:50S ribosomal protein L29 [Verrucomicrobiota bacterium]